jgi:ABC-type branched-subunit amino acid transport system ATPase component
VIRRSRSAAQMAILLVEQYYDFARRWRQITHRGSGATMKEEGIAGLLTI